MSKFRGDVLRYVVNAVFLGAVTIFKAWMELKANAEHKQVCAESIEQSTRDFTPQAGYVVRAKRSTVTETTSFVNWALLNHRWRPL